MANYEETFGKLVEVQQMMGALRHRHSMEGGPFADTTRGRGRVLALLKMRDGLATRDMANVLGIRVSSLNETIARLEAEDYVERRQSPDDGRVMLVYLTEKGLQAEQPALDLPGRLFGGFSDDELQILDGYLVRMQEVLQEELGDGWQEEMRRMHERREQIFHQAAARGPWPHGGHGPRHDAPQNHGHGHRGRNGHGPDHGNHGEGDFHGDHPHGGHHGQARPSEGHGHGGNGNDGAMRSDARYARDAELELCDHNCRACTRPVCIRRG